jgi:hypothetical protein
MSAIPTDNLFAMAQAEHHANHTAPSWTEQAAAFLASYAEAHETFTGEDVVAAAHGVVPDPPTTRAWGGIFHAASHRGDIVKTGDTKPRSNGSPQFVWRRAQ